MTRVPVSDARRDLSNTLNKVAYGGERIILHRHDKDVAAIISLEDLDLLERLEDAMDLQLVREALAESGATISWDMLKASHWLSGDQVKPQLRALWRGLAVPVLGLVLFFVAWAWLAPCWNSTKNCASPCAPPASGATGSTPPRRCAWTMTRSLSSTQ